MPHSAAARAFRLETFREVTSTNDEAIARARKGDSGRLWIAAGTQTNGRGRSGRLWASPSGNLYASLLLIDPAPAQRVAELGFVCGVAAAHALRDILQGDGRLAIKWPNDILHSGAKLCGILLESAILPDGRLACAAGIGVNCASHPGNTPYPATDLAAITGAPAAPPLVFAKLSAAMADWLDVWAAGAGFESIRTEWLSLAAGVGTRIRVKRPSHTVEGIFQTIDQSGRLIVAQDHGMSVIDAGDVFFLPPCSAAAAGHG